MHIHCKSKKLHHFIFANNIVTPSCILILTHVYLNKFATKQHQAHQYLLKDLGIMLCEAHVT